MRRSLSYAVIAVVTAIGITATMDATGLSVFSALPLCPLALILWSIERSSRQEVGISLGRPSDYLLAFAYPMIIIGACAIAALGFGAINPTNAPWPKTASNIAIAAAATTVAALLTEEGFFRGVLWASLERGGLRRTQVLWLTSIAFALWHISAVSLHTGFDPPAAQVPTFLINAMIMGAIWGRLRQASNSILVSSVAHGVWNGFAYVLFGYGTKVGALGVQAAAIYGPEVGVVGLALNCVALGLVWQLTTLLSSATAVRAIA